MKLSDRIYPRIIAVLTLTGILLGAANVVVATKRRMAVSSTTVSNPPASNSASATEVLRPNSKMSRSESATPAPPPFSWKPFESSDYKAYIANLRKLSFPEELIRELIVADIDKLYAPREEPLKWKPAPPDAPLAERRRQPTTQDIKNLMQYRDLQIEKQSVLQELLGVHVPREILRTPNSRNYEGYEYAISQLPPEKRDAVQRIQEDEFLNDDLNQTRYGGYGSSEEVEDYRKLNDRVAAEFQAILTPDEYQQYILNSTPPGTEMARRIVGMDPTEEEMLKIWRITHEQWKEEGGVYGRWHAEPRTQEQIAAAVEKLHTGLKNELGEDRYLDYEMAINETGQQLRNLAARYDLPRETLANAFAVQKNLDALTKPPRRSRPSQPAPEAPPPERIADLQQQLRQALGDEIYEAWTSGRKLSYSLEP